MGYDIDYDFEFETDEHGMPYLPDGLTRDGRLYVLPNGKYLPSGAYLMRDGSSLIYEPHELSPFADMLREIHANGPNEEDEAEDWEEEE